MGKIILLTGDLQSGKTHLCLDIYQQAKEAQVRVGGVISPAVFQGDRKIAIDALDLKSGARKRMAELRTAHQSGLETERWSFNSEVVDWGNKMLMEAVPCDLLLIDELGPLEFQRNEGWMNGFAVIEERKYSAALIVIRPSLIDEAVRLWQTSGIIDLDQNPPKSSLIAEIFEALDPSLMLSQNK